MSIVLSDQEYTALVDKANYVREENNYLRAEIERMKQLISDRELLLTIEGTKALGKERDAFKAEIERLRQTSGEYCEECGWSFVVPGEGCLNCLYYPIKAERDALRTKLERVRELCVSNKKHGIGVVGVDNLLEILDGEEVKKHGVC